MALRIPSPNCGSRPHTELWRRGELRESPISRAPDAEFEYVWMRRNGAGPEIERWFHYAGLRRWPTLEREDGGE